MYRGCVWMNITDISATRPRKRRFSTPPCGKISRWAPERTTQLSGRRWKTWIWRSWRALPDGLDTCIGERGITLSGGERQRLALARLYFAENARLFMLDEATSALDSVTEERVLGRLMEALKGRTVIMIAHRLDTLRNADFIMLMQDGKLVGQGSYVELARTNAYFGELLRSETEKAE